MRQNLTFGDALQAAKYGWLISREGWNGKGMFVFVRPADKIHIEDVVYKIKSLPQSVKDYFLQDLLYEKGNRHPAEADDMVEFTAYLCLKAADGTIVNGWLASQTDILAHDWCVLD